MLKPTLESVHTTESSILPPIVDYQDGLFHGKLEIPLSQNIVFDGHRAIIECATVEDIEEVMSVILGELSIRYNKNLLAIRVSSPIGLCSDAYGKVPNVVHCVRDLQETGYLNDSGALKTLLLFHVENILQQHQVIHMLSRLEASEDSANVHVIIVTPKDFNTPSRIEVARYRMFHGLFKSKDVLPLTVTGRRYDRSNK